MKIFLESSSLFEVRKSVEYGLIDGVLLASEKREEPCVARDSDIKSIVQSVRGPVFVSVCGSTADEILVNSQQVLSMGPNTVLEIQVSLEGLKACNYLKNKDCSVNVCGITKTSQAVLAAISRAHFVSFNMSKLPASEKISCECLQESMNLLQKYNLKSEVIAYNFDEIAVPERAIEVGVDAVTLPYGKLIGLIET
ncbi:transaldolase family protein [Maridesulfovibrio hydrothermalis]|uniref:transaldolase family protein n=1 Tax=Maridesulfovibrio hydrothermalis TaxID=191026 RepID=UPI00031B6C9D|nr:transaldolase family protein [Maridesulfovibrio hydrothermalis]